MEAFADKHDVVQPFAELHGCDMLSDSHFRLSISESVVLHLARPDLFNRRLTCSLLLRRRS